MFSQPWRNCKLYISKRSENSLLRADIARYLGVPAAADAGSAGVGTQRPRIETESPEVIMFREAERASGDEWAVLGSNQCPEEP
jgi:hypothetical protein